MVRWVVSAVPHLSWEPGNQPLPQAFIRPISGHGLPPKGPSWRLTWSQVLPRVPARAASPLGKDPYSSRDRAFRESQGELGALFQKHLVTELGREGMEDRRGGTPQHEQLLLGEGFRGGLWRGAVRTLFILLQHQACPCIQPALYR